MKRLLILFLLLSACSQPKPSPIQEQATDALFTIQLTDTYLEPLPGIQKLTLSVSQIHLHSETGWQTLTQNAKRYDLVQLRKSQQTGEVYHTRLQPGHYDQVKFYLTQASLTQKNRNQVVYLTGNELALPLNLDIQAGQAYTILLDLNTQKSLHPAKYNEYVFTPQLEVQIKNKETLLERYTIGMDEHGNVEKNTRIHPDIEFRIVNNKIRVVQPLLHDSGAGINLYVQSQGSQTPITLILKEVRLQNNITVSVYKGEQELLLNPTHVQQIASEQVPSDQYEQIKLYFEDTGTDEQGNLIELTTPILVIPANLTTAEDQTLQVLLKLPVQEQGNRYTLQTPEIEIAAEKSIRTDASRTGNTLYIPYADLKTIQEANQEGLFQS